MTDRTEGKQGDHARDYAGNDSYDSELLENPKRRWQHKQGRSNESTSSVEYNLAHLQISRFDPLVSILNLRLYISKRQIVDVINGEADHYHNNYVFSDAQVPAKQI